ncbi:hypothetical protein DYI22_13680 [Marinobacter lipolyticus]|nr:hypothetical protein [Marinobacter lipolyticus]
MLHISTLVFWVGFLLYLPALVSFSPDTERTSLASDFPEPAVTRMLFTHVATPIALLAIIAGTLVFVAYQIIQPWLIVKMTLVVLLVVNHIVVGLLVMRAETGNERFLRSWCLLSTGTTCSLATAVLWLVLAKPDLG